MLTIRIGRRASRALGRLPANVADLIEQKIEQYAADPAALANNVTALKGQSGYRLRVGDWRVIFAQEDETMVILDIGPRGSIYG